ncbi:MAG TPA: phosphatidate cytidylyltransferase [Acidimicrobiales bacterium]|nr:phosphatidate cytidylyltransferase [Acidimicrobiales bacterium]
MDDRDEYEPEPEDDVEPVTERVRIIGAQPAGMSRGAPGDAAGAAPAAGEGHDAGDEGAEVRDQLSFPAVGGLSEADARSAERATHNGGDPLEPGSAIFPREPAPAVPDMPHWTDPPTGQVPAVLDRRGEDDAEGWAAAGDTGPAWREHSHEWEDSGFDPSLLADEETRVGALEDRPLEERRPWEFDDLQRPTAGEERPEAAPAGGGASWWDEDAGSPAPAPEPAAAGRAEAPGPGTDPEHPVTSISSSPLRLGPRDSGGHPAPGRARPPRPPEPAEGGSGHGPTRNMPVAIATGLGFALVAVICFEVGTVATLVLSTVVVALAAAECYAAFRARGRRPATFPGLVATVMVMVAAYAKGVAALPLVLVLVVVTSMIWYLVGAERGSPVEGIATTVFGFAWVGLLGSFAALMLSPSQYPHRHGIAFVLGAIVAAIGADVGALAVGSWLGRHPLAPRVSPGKTWEGFVGGAVLSVALSAAVTGQVHPWTVPKAALLGVVVAVVAPIGDLCESLVKRDLGIKDMGAILPGHGGVLDRIDALLFVLPATYYLVRVLNLG